MKASIKHKKKLYNVDFSKPLDISIPITGATTNVNAWYIKNPEITPHTEDKFVGKVSEGASTNFNDVWFNPHAHGTHTECVGHITEEFHSVNQNLKQFFFLAEVITIAPERNNGDFVISKKQLQYALKDCKCEAVVIRTLPNIIDKLQKQYSNTNPPYLLEEAALYLVELGVEHLLVDLPSVDKEKDGGALVSHNAFWNTAGKIRFNATITEFVYVNNAIKDGGYILNIQVAAFENDASPSRPVLYKIEA
ncbi:cyclase family protein [Cellulophaga sp. HaHaR_3_176]|uniref:cyclase family protein n=1 Tax=Cellulophaga sp. HaHaR_3_176 TaxID=1942464 RepID=UPI001C1FD0F8|nr:cyclase family protein [Cellulophaga sp. HaHaR_3_176]QWX83997.1 cyclase family protein [Cellulophaga sp. HaHaR_3_176]